MPARKPLSGNGQRSPRRVLADELARLRAESGLSLRELAGKVGWDHAHLSKMEQSKALGGPELIEALDDVYRTKPLLMRLWELAAQGIRFRDKYVRYMHLEAEATTIESYVPQTIPGLLQTEDYARTLLWSARHTPDDLDELEEQVTARLARQERLRREHPPFLRVIIDEAAFRRPLRDPAQWKRQLAHLVEMAALPHVTIQVLPFAAGPHELLGGSLHLLRVPDGRTLAWLESSKHGELVEGLAEVEAIRLAYDGLRDIAWSPPESVDFLRQLIEGDSPCEPPGST